MVDIGRFDSVWAVAFHPDGMHLLGGCTDGIRRWRVADDGQEVGRQLGMDVNAISVSSDDRRIVYETQAGASVWDGKGHRGGGLPLAPMSTQQASGTSSPGRDWLVHSNMTVMS